MPEAQTEIVWKRGRGVIIRIPKRRLADRRILLAAERLVALLQAPESDRRGSQ